MGTFGKEIHRLMKAIDAIRDDEADMPTQQVQVFLAVALRPGITAADLGRSVGMSQSSVSRNTSALGKWHRLGVPGMDYVEAIEDPTERRRKIHYLTTKGCQRMKAALEAMTDGPVEFESPTAHEACAVTHRGI